MATLTIRNLDEAVRDRLRRRAAEDGHSMEEEVRQILRQLIRAPRAWWQALEQEGHSNPWLLGKQTNADYAAASAAFAQWVEFIHQATLYNDEISGIAVA
ncbi:hypothetical protein SynRS9909_01672 [Synechococcus sp. RS9909]|uniref:FitA-like ribbon-helix-helix domain-containing protein n=1 Tax=unclassified Synechococcus TaxID=2626047 RepID=UPI000068F7B4|nr:MULTISPECIES: hypothetical protein [unclassified Synechococcus]EAQ69086.1 hypothetical protein RS9917_11620 [Synechococcus sp. RS9917]QNI79656.1 hypothetical protein SynRS9909_01672 [Synechococcus sp. RS9909]